MMSNLKVMIRGIYTTALTKLLSDRGFLIARPSPITAERFNLGRVYEENVLVADRSDKQGVEVEGEAEPAEAIVQTLLQVLPDIVVREKTLSEFLAEKIYSRLSLQPGFLSFDVEFPRGSKLFLDRVRSQITATINNHHLLKIVASDLVDEYESLLRSQPERAEELSNLALETLVYRKLTPRVSLTIQHVKPDGSILRLGEGRILYFQGRKLTLHRMIFGEGSKYDGLGVPKASTDYAVTLAEEGSPILRHSYYSGDGVLKGEFYNINTPIEFYPDRIRYVDLEIDVVRRPHRQPEIVDVDKLEEAVESGFISGSSAEAAKGIAQRLVAELSVAEIRS